MATLDDHPADLFCTGYRLRKATRRATQIYDHALAPHGLTVTQYSLLAMLARDGEMPLGALAERVGMDRTSMSRTIRPLLKAGHVAMAGTKDDRRVRKVALTGDGGAIFNEASRAWQAAQQLMGRALGRENLESLHGLLGAVARLPVSP